MYQPIYLWLHLNIINHVVVPADRLGLAINGDHHSGDVPTEKIPAEDILRLPNIRG